MVRGTTLIEASAGTGKTYNITSLVVRLVAEEGVRIERVLVVTYTRAATAELKDRIRARLVAAVVALSEPGVPEDPVLAHLWSEDPTTRSLRVRRLRDALEGFDQALISTIHGFCQRMLQQNAFESGVSFDHELTPDVDDLVEELVDDHLTASFYAADAARLAFLRGPCGFDREKLKALAKAALDDPDTAVVPGTDAADEAAWGPMVSALAADWPGLADGFVAAVGQAVADAKAGRPSPLKPGQRKHNAEAARTWADAVGVWLRGGPAFGTSPPEAGRFDAKAMKDQLTQPDAPLEHPCLDRLAAVRAFPGAVAGALRAAFVAQVRRTFEQRKALRRVQTYQDLLRGLALRLADGADPADRLALVAAIGGSFDAALIDEFQDTDPHQWTIFGRVFGQGVHHLFLIGDPKQAIYGFRGANIHVYNAATAFAGERRYTMATNWRSDRRLLDALNHLLDVPAGFGAGVPFAYVPVQPPADGGTDGLRPAGGWEGPASAPLQVRWFDERLAPTGKPGDPIPKNQLAGVLEARVAEDVVDLLTSKTPIRSGPDWRPIQPADVAILVRKGRQAVALQAALQAVGVPAVLTGAASVLASDEARELQRWLEALADPSGGAASRVAASTVLFRWTAAELLAVEAEDPDAVARWDRWLGQLAAWRELLVRRGFLEAFRRALDDEGVIRALLTLDGGERRVTNLLHVAELVHSAEGRERLQLSALLTWLSQRRSDEELDGDEAELRLDRDADAVRILTMHKAKGLEFPVCFVPYLWDGGMTAPKGDKPLVVADPADPGRRLLDVGVPVDAAHVALATKEAKEEGLRLAYVALTRAKHRCVAYAGHAKDYEHSPLAAILHGDGPDRIAAGRRRVEAGEGLRADVEARAAGASFGGAPIVSVVDCAPPTYLRWAMPAREPPTLSTRTFGRLALDPGWRRHSYTSLTKAAGHYELVEDDREGFDADEADEGAVAAVPAAAEVPLAPFPGGAEAGTLLHDVFEHADFAEDADALRLVVDARLEQHGFDAQRYGAMLAGGLDLVLGTPLGAAVGELRLRDVPRGARLDELRFDLPVLGGTAWRGDGDPCGPTQRLVAALRTRTDGVLPADWLASLDRLDRVRLAGFLTGSIDLVFRAPVGGQPRWFVVDYKSNRLDPAGAGRCVPEAFGAAGMTQEMAKHDYFLQYHLYLIALHRFLRWRLPGYDYDRDVGGVYYLFFRGMVGPATVRDGDRVRGCWFDRPPREVVEALDRALELDGGVA